MTNLPTKTISNTTGKIVTPETLKKRVPWTEQTIPLDEVLKAPFETIIFMEGWYEFFVTKKSAHKDGLHLFLAFRVHFREGDLMI